MFNARTSLTRPLLFFVIISLVIVSSGNLTSQAATLSASDPTPPPVHRPWPPLPGEAPNFHAGNNPPNPWVLLQRMQPATVIPTVVTPDPLIQTMIAQVVTPTLYQYESGLTGNQSVWVDGDWYTITTRNTNSGAPIQKATHYVGQHLASLGLTVEYHVWSNSTNPNVIGELPGETDPDKIVIICAHLDDVSGTQGADDNASGSVAVLMAADILTQYHWKYTLRFALWTGEEQGLLGSYAYAQRASQLGENIVGVLNLDMISWNTPSSSPGIDLYYSSSITPTHDLALLFQDVVSAYTINLVPGLGTGEGGSDHAAFWNFGYTAILGIEDEGDFNPYYHSAQDTLAHVNMPYFAEFTKAAVGTFAHMGGLIGDVGVLNGYVADASTGAPLTATITATGGLVPITTASDISGYYTVTLPADTYTVTAQAHLYGYTPAVITHVVILTDAVVNLDLPLSPYPSYIISGAVTDALTGLPITATVTTVACPGGACQSNTYASVSNDPLTGYYSATLVWGDYTLRVRANGYRPVTQTVHLDSNQTANFALVTQGCLLLVDDDGGENVQAGYQADLSAIGFNYSTWTVAGQGAPPVNLLEQYRNVLWLTGRRYENILAGAAQNMLGAYLDGGGNLLLSSWGAGGDLNGDPFLANYLHAGFNGDVVAGDVSLAGAGWMAGHPLTITTAADQQVSKLTPLGGAVAIYNLPAPYNRAAAVAYAGNYKLAYLGFGLETVADQGDRRAALDAALDWLGPCRTSLMASFETSSPDLVGALTLFTNTTSGVGPFTFTWNWGDGAPLTLQPSGQMTITHGYTRVGIYTAWLTAANMGGTVVVSGAVEITGTAPQAGFVSSSPVVLAQAMVFTNTTVAGAPIETSYVWSFGDGIGRSTEASPIYTYTKVGTYTVWLTATNLAGRDVFSHAVQVMAPPSSQFKIYLPITLK